LASAVDILRTAAEQETNLELSFFQKLKRWCYPPAQAECTAVCVPPGARLLLRDIPAKMQQQFCLCCSVQEVTFTQIGTVGFRDAVRFANDKELLLQRLTEGQRVRVLALSTEEPDFPAVLKSAVLSEAHL